MSSIGVSEAARILGLSRTALRRQLERLAEAGAARQEGGRWRLDREHLEQAYDEVVAPSGNSPRQGGGDRVTPPNEFQPVPDAGDLGPDASRNEAERQGAIAKARLAQLNVQEREGQLVASEDVARRWFQVCRRSRDQVLSLPSRIAADLAAEVDPIKVSILLERELTQCLAGLDASL